ncbi:hypothetical protein M404DRAFT_946964 [Pisolithus tinctorius Marx 270]|uniref:Fe2OG dioxygenase domain-containing protein n=1 Tax=Pisolithus tinctorius Marx 270 TaxID=870435 RepID=A0A0C3K961_PISTI|nr:hypothetical protein M404DRAFT_946964 [Pisolithus tinctorius Marx 270]
MGLTEAPLRLPTIDIAPHLEATQSNSSERAAVSKALHEACVEYGFFYLDISKYVDPGEPEELTRLAREFFFLPQEEKDKISITLQDNARGYQRLKENVTNGKADNHEGIDIYRPVGNPDKSKTLWGENQWPTIPGFREKYEQWVEKMRKLGMIVMEAMADGLGLKEDEWKEFRSQVEDSFWYMRIIGYPPLPNDYDGFSVGAHKDYGCLTLLYADPTRSALQVFLHRSGHTVTDVNGLPDEQDGEEGVWIDADPIPGCVVCNIGSMWEVWSNGLYKSTLHRVIHRGANYRIPFFFEPNFDANVKPLPAAIAQTGDVQVYKPVEYSKFLLSKVSYNFSLEGM